MLLDIPLMKYRWLMTNVPEILHSLYDWNRWLNNLNSYDLANFRMNISGIEESKSMIEDEFDNYAPWTEEFECFLDIRTRLIELLFLIKN